MQITTDRLFMRPWTMDDAKHYRAMSLDIGINCFAPPGIYLARDEADLRDKVKQRIERFEKTGTTKFPIFEKATGQFVGICGGDLFDLERAQPPAQTTRAQDLEVELGYRLMLSHWGKGYATEAATAMLTALHRELQRKTIYAFALTQNKPSLKILEKIGFEYQRSFVWAELAHKLYAHKI